MNNDTAQTQKDIRISKSYRCVENGHILLWLIKDTSWAMVWRPGGIFMIMPTLGVAFFILWKSRRIRAELYHNMAVPMDHGKFGMDDRGVLCKRNKTLCCRDIHNRIIITTCVLRILFYQGQAKGEGIYFINEIKEEKEIQNKRLTIGQPFE